MKRHYPFNNSGSCHQRKIHIGLKEIDLGVESHQRMPGVYEKTVNLMLSSAKNYWSNYIKNACTKENDTVYTTFEKDNFSSNKRDYKQLTLENFANSTPLKCVPGASRDRPPGSLGSKRCSSCLPSIATLTQEVCHFCENSLCSICCRRCYRCDEIFCPLCSIKIYSEKEDSAKCFSCS